MKMKSLILLMAALAVAVGASNCSNVSNLPLYENCVMPAGTSISVRVATFKNVTWTRGSLAFTNATDVNITIERCTMRNMTSVLDWGGVGNVTNVTIRVLDSVIEASGNILAFGGTSAMPVLNITMVVERSSLRGGRGVMAVLLGHTGGERVFSRIRMTAINSTVAASGSTYGIAAMGIARSVDRDGPIRVDGLELTAINSTVTATGASSNWYVAVLGVANRGDTTAYNTAISFIGTRASSTGQYYVVVGGWSVNGALIGGNMSAAAVHSRVEGSGSHYLSSMGWFAQHDMQINNASTVAVNSSVSCSGSSSMASMGWLASNGNMQINNASAMAVNSNVTCSGSYYLASMGWWAAHGDMQISNTSSVAVNSSVSCSGSHSLASMGWWAWSTMQISNASTMAVNSSVSCSGSGNLILAMAVGAFTVESAPRLVTVTGLTFLCCNVTLFSTENALTVVSRAFNGATYSILGTPTSSSIRYLLSNTTVTTQKTPAPLGDCLTIPPSGPLPSVIVNSTLRCGGATGNRTTSTQLYVDGSVVAHFPGAGNVWRLKPFDDVCFGEFVPMSLTRSPSLSNTMTNTTSPSNTFTKTRTPTGSTTATQSLSRSRSATATRPRAKSSTPTATFRGSASATSSPVPTATTTASMLPVRRRTRTVSPAETSSNSPTRFSPSISRTKTSGPAFTMTRARRSPSLSPTITAVQQPQPAPLPTRPTLESIVPPTVQQAIDSTSTTAAVASSLQNPTAALSLAKMSSIRSFAACAFDHTESFPRIVNPLGLEFGAAHGKAYRGTVIGNLVLFVAMSTAFVMIVAIVTLVRFKRSTSGASIRETFSMTCADAHLPSSLFVPAAICYQGTVSASVSIFVHATDKRDLGYGVFGFIACLAFPAVVAWVTCIKTNFHAMFTRREEEVGDERSLVDTLHDYFFGSDMHWVNAHPSNPLWKKQYMFLFADFSLRWYMVVEFGTAMLVGVAEGMRIEDDDVCFALVFVPLLCSLTLVYFVVVKKASLIRTNTLFLVALNGITAALSVLTMLEIRGVWASPVTDLLTDVALLLSAVKVAIDISILLLWGLSHRHFLTRFVVSGHRFDVFMQDRILLSDVMLAAEHPEQDVNGDDFNLSVSGAPESDVHLDAPPQVADEQPPQRVAYDDFDEAAFRRARQKLEAEKGTDKSRNGIAEFLATEEAVVESLADPLHIEALRVVEEEKKKERETML